MDYQNGIIDRIENGEELLAIARNLIRTFREHGGTVGYVRVAFEEGDWDGVPETSHMAKRVKGYPADALHVNSPATQIPEEIAPQDGRHRRHQEAGRPVRDHRSARAATGARDRHIGPPGISTSGVVLSTVRDAHDRDYRVVVIADACADPDQEAHDFLTGRIFPHQVEVTDARGVHALLH